jgi:hypothetical protein
MFNVLVFPLLKRQWKASSTDVGSRVLLTHAILLGAAKLLFKQTKLTFLLLTLPRVLIDLGNDTRGIVTCRNFLKLMVIYVFT